MDGAVNVSLCINDVIHPGGASWDAVAVTAEFFQRHRFARMRYRPGGYRGGELLAIYCAGGCFALVNLRLVVCHVGLFVFGEVMSRQDENNHEGEKYADYGKSL